jgi:uncharacterized membrane protein YbhN (UPF0104 family)
LNLTPPEIEEVPAASSRSRQYAIFALKFAVAGVLVWWLSQSGRLDWKSLLQVRPNASLFGMVFWQAAMLGCIAARWHFLVRAVGLSLSWKQTLRISLIGHCAAVWTPAGLGLDGVRLWRTRRLVPGDMPRVLASTFWDRALGVWTILILSAIGCAVLLFLAPFDLMPELRRALWGVLLFCAVLSLWPLIPQRWFFALLQKRLSNQANASVASLDFQSANWKAALLLAFATHGCNALALWCALRALGGGESLPSTLLVAPLVILSSLIPLTPLGLGVTDAAASTLIHLIGNSSGAEATMLGRATFVMLSALCGLAWLWPEERNK